jgi:serine/threonine protein kinase
MNTNQQNISNPEVSVLYIQVINTNPAVHLVTGEEVAIKKVDVSSLTTDEIYKITKEALLLQSFRHKNIVKFINCYIHNNEYYTVMEYARGNELANYVYDSGMLSEKEAKRIFKHVLDAVIYLHNRGVVHRDLKPNNIMFLDEEKVNVVVYLVLI